MQLQVAVKFVDKKKVLEWVKVRSATYSLRIHIYKNHISKLPRNFLHNHVTCGRGSDLLLMTVQYVMYFRFCG